MDVCAKNNKKDKQDEITKRANKGKTTFRESLNYCAASSPFLLDLFLNSEKGGGMPQENKTSGFRVSFQQTQI